MSHKTHTIGFRLGTTQPNFIQLQCYGQIIPTYSSLILRLRNLMESLERILAHRMIYLGSLEWTIKDTSFHLNTVYTSYEAFKNDKGKINIKWVAKDKFKGGLEFKTLVPYNAICTWMNSFEGVMKFHRVHWLHNPKTLSSWIITQLEQKQSVKTVLKLLRNELAQNKHWSCETKSFVSGNTKFHLTGIKISCRGRLRGKRQRMTNKVDKQLGVMPLQEFNAFVEYERSSLCTRFGKVGIHVYYYYSKKSNV